jgi:PDZ domain-containing protein
VIEPGDTIVAVDGQPVERREDLARAIDAKEPGDPIRLRIEDPDGERRRAVVELGSYPDAPDEPFLGVGGLVTRDLAIEYPFEITIDTGDIIGPSAGLAFTLAILDVLTPGDLSGDTPVAVTGTINGLAQVGPVGGVEFKAVAAMEAGAEVFLVPEREVEQARELVGDDLRIEGVATLDDALRVLDDLGGNAMDLQRPDPEP